MKLLHSQSQKEVHGFPYNLCLQSFFGHFPWLFIGHFGASKPGGRVLPYKSLMEMRRRMGSHFQDWIGCNGVAFSVELLQWGRTFSDFWGQKVLYMTRLANVPECLYCR